MLVSWVLIIATAAADPGELVPIGRLDEAIREASGIAASRRHPGVFWVHSDSGNPPVLFAVKRDGSLVARYRVGAPNIDWEEIAIDDAGHLYLGDTGNNDNLLPLRVIHEIEEPDPSRPEDEPLRVLRSTFYRFTPGERFDCEAFYLDGPRIVLISKRRDGVEAGLYTIPLDPPAPMLRPAVPQRIGSLPGFTEPATGASLARDGRLLAVCSTTATRVYERTTRDAWVPVGLTRYRVDQIEAVTWAGRDLILAGEERGVFLLREQVWRSRRAEPGRR
jgi:hypothetical protein